MFQTSTWDTQLTSGFLKKKHLDQNHAPDKLVQRVS